MFIVNPESITGKIKISKRQAKYLEKHEISLLSTNGKSFYVSDIEQVRELLKKKMWFM